MYLTARNTFGVSGDVETKLLRRILAFRQFSIGATLNDRRGVT
jgi:hypothetical protein